MRRSSFSAGFCILVAAAELAAAASFQAPRGVSLPAAPLSAPVGAALPGASAPLAPLSGAVAPTIPPMAGISRPLSAPAALPAAPVLAAAAAAPQGPAAAPGKSPSASAQAHDLASAAPGAAGARFDHAALPMPDAKDLEKVDPLDFEPMQIPVGMREVERKEKDLRALGEKDQKKWLQERAVPYVKRAGRRRPIDHHHETRAAWQAGKDHVYAYSAVTKEDQKKLDAMSDPEFWAEMKRRGWYYDKDQFGEGPRTPDNLPEDTRGHADDPFRSVAGEVRRRGGYDKTSIPFAEFDWANFFRTRVKTYPRGDDGYERAVQEALALAKSSEAADLPGYKGAK